MIVLSGSNSKIGKSILSVLRTDYQVCEFDKERGDIRDYKLIERLFEEIQPQIFINCTQYDNIEKCELYREEAYNINALAIGKIAELCKMKNITILQISSSYVYSCQKRIKYSEDSILEPETVYGDSLAYGEKLIQESAVEYLILRIPELINKEDSNINKFINSIRKKKGFTIIKDQIVSIIDSNILAENILILLKNKIKGIYNIAAQPAINKKELLFYLLEKYNKYYEKNHEAEIIEKSYEEIISVFDEPMYCQLSLDKIQQIDQIKIIDWKDLINNFVEKNINKF